MAGLDAQFLLRESYICFIRLQYEPLMALQHVQKMF